MLPTTGGFFCATCRRLEQETMLHDRRAAPLGGALAHDEKTPALGAKPVFESEFRLEPVRPSEVLKAPRDETPPLPGAFDATRVMQAVRAPSPVPPAAPAPPVSPPAVSEERRASADEALFLPRCKECERPLDIEEIADGICRSCAERLASAEESAAAPGATGRTVAGLVAGELAALAALWAGALALVRAVMSNPDTWKTPDLVRELARAALVVFSFVSAVAWCRARAWAAGVALFLGPAAVVLAASKLRSGSLVGDLPAASAWILAGLAGLAVALAAAAGALAGGAGADEPGGEHPAGLDSIRRRLSGRSARRPPRRRARPAIGGALALAGAALAAWRSAVEIAALSSRSAATDCGGLLTKVLPVSGLSVAALAGLALALVLFVAPPPGRTHTGALLAAVVAGALPCWLGLGLWASGSSETLWLAPAAALGNVLRVSALSDASPGALALAGRGAGFWVVLASSLALGGALAGSVWALAGRPLARGKALAGFAMAGVLVWGSSLAVAALGG